MFSGHRQRLALDDVRRLFPLRAPHAEWTRVGEEIRVTVRRSPGAVARVVSWFFTVPDRRSFLLDRPGAAVWQRCDGRVPVGALVAAMAEEFGWSLQHAERAVLVYLGMLSERRLVGFLPAPVPAS